MQAELVVPEVGESIREVEIGEWLKHEGDHVDKDEVVARLESDKATVEVVAPASGVLQKIVKEEGATAEVGEVIAYVGEEEAEREEPSEPEAEPETEAEHAEEAAEEEPERAEEEAEKAEEEPERAEEEPETSTEIELEVEPRVMPSARRALDEHEIRPEDVEATGPGGRVLEEDVERHVRERAAPAPRGEKVVPMSPIRRRIAARLVEAQRNAALLTTFNEVDMSAVKALRAELGEAFREAHGVKLGLVSFFVKAVVEALRAIPEVGAEVRDGSLVTREACDVGIAVGGGKGLVVPVLRDADRMSFADVERTIADLARRAREGRLELSELQGGVFTISNGGIYGSLLSTPIVNPPQSGVLGMHAVQDRPVARDGRVEIRPMMYVALTYDHRVVDGREAVTFLRRIKDVVESPARLLLGI